MRNSKQLFQDFVSKMKSSTGRTEVEAVAQLVLDHMFGLSRADILAGKGIMVNTEDQSRLDDIILRLNCHEPIQYILGEAHFFGRKFRVSPAVLIPRPETEELVHMVTTEVKSSSIASPVIVDIGTGSGCIATTLSLELFGADVTGTDVSKEAVSLAQGNSKRLGADTRFILHDILADTFPISKPDVVVSNPPYIAYEEHTSMERHVVEHEPHLALFVPDDDPLVFYRAIALKSKSNLAPGGFVAVEINERFGKEVASIFMGTGYRKVKVRNDIGGKERFVFAWG